MAETPPSNPDAPRAPGPNDPLPPPAQPDFAMHMLYNEQMRLRAELDALRKKQEQQGEKKEGGEEGREGGEKKQGGGEGKDKKDGDDKSKKKPPVTQRTREWIRRYPLGTAAIVIVFLLLVVLTIWLFVYLGSYETTDDAFVEGHTDPISARINGFATGVYVENTYRVKKGQLLVQLDPRDYQVAKEQAVAQLSQAKANVAAQQPNVPITAVNQSTQVVQAEANVASSEANVYATRERHRSAVADLEQAQANEANAAREEERYRLLVVKEEVSREMYDQRATAQRAQAAVVASRKDTADAAEKQVTQAEAQLRQAQAQLKQAKGNLPRQVAVQRATLAERKASEQSAQAQADRAELSLEYTRIYAPEDGIIGDKNVQLSTQVTAGEEMFALTQTNDLWITANFKETDVQSMHPGQSVTVHVDALSADFAGYVEALPGGTGAVYSLLPPENATGNYVKVVQRLPVRIRLKPGQAGEERLAPGMSVEPKVWIK